MATNNFVLDRSVIQTFDESEPNDALMQAGIYRRGTNFHLDTCVPPNTKFYAFMEYHPLNSGANGYRCAYYYESDPGIVANFNVYLNPAGWNVRIAGNLYATHALGGVDSAHVMIGSEINSASSGSYATDVNTLYGGTGTSSWMYYLGQSRTDPVEVTEPGNTALLQGIPSNWSVGSVPTPLSVTHPS